MSLDVKTASIVRPVAFPGSLLLPGFAVTLFVGACLLFLVQPMVSKMMLPHLGGSPNVWNTCMCFFQAMLLLGYAYAHWLTTRFGGLAQAAIHAAVLGAAALFLPFDLTTQLPPAEGSPVPWLIARLATTVGPPFFAISATAPLLQRWFSRTDHPAAGDPYFLYAASNAGSLLALLAYPLIVEPALPLWQQSRDWSFGLGLLAFGIALCWIGYRSHMAAAPAVAEAVPRPAVAERLRWVAYAFVPSSLLLAVTAYITTDLASAPLFWVVPLALYLATFIVAFSRRPLLPHRLMLRLQPLLIIPVVILSVGLHSVWLLLLHLACFFVIAMVCHGELARSRPNARDLTEFYLWISLGGVLGGLFDALLAPLLFPDIWEYPLMLVAASAIRPAGRAEGKAAWRGDLLLPALLLSGLLALLLLGDLPTWLVFAASAIAAVVLVKFSERRWRFALGVAACLIFVQLLSSGETLATTRSFFGVNRVRLMEDGAVRALQHGTTVHGVEITRPGGETIPAGYYSREGPFGRFFAAIAARGVSRVGVLGLGTGGLACYARPGQSWTFHEIDPAVEKLARDGRFFHFLEACGNHPRIVLGDARLTLDEVPDHGYDLIMIDAFSSDSIPLHLMTREALALYQRKLAPGGTILFQISNRYLDLAPVVAALARDAGAPARHMFYLPPEPSTIERLGAEVMAVGQPGGNLDFLTDDAGWQSPPTPSALWTDERSDVISRIRWR
jgi:spermidine synthase